MIVIFEHTDGRRIEAKADSLVIPREGEFVILDEGFMGTVYRVSHQFNYGEKTWDFELDQLVQEITINVQ
jgi:hypothetical protein